MDTGNTALRKPVVSAAMYVFGSTGNHDVVVFANVAFAGAAFDDTDAAFDEILVRNDSVSVYSVGKPDMASTMPVGATSHIHSATGAGQCAARSPSKQHIPSH